MEKKECQEWVEANIEDLMENLGLQHWGMRVIYDRIEGDCTAKCSTDFKYEHACITVDYEEVENVDKLQKLFRHELLHIIHSPFSCIYSAVERAKDISPEFDELWSVAMELTVKNLERMYYKLKGDE